MSEHLPAQHGSSVLLRELHKIECARGDSNPYILSDTATSRLRVYQFRHSR